MALTDRVQGMLLRPREEWKVIDGEQTTTADLYRGYVAPLAAVGPIATAIGMLAFLPGVGVTRVVVEAAIGFALALAIVYVLALVVDNLAPTFGGTRSQMQALKVSAYSCTAAFLAGIFAIVPWLSFLGILGLYSLYQLHTGLPVLMKAPAERTVAYTATVIVVTIVITMVLSTVYALVFPRVI